MGLVTKNRKRQTADICTGKRYCDKLALVKEFVVEIEGVRKDCAATHGPVHRHQNIKQETLKAARVALENWLNRGNSMKREPTDQDQEKIDCAIIDGDRIEATSMYISITDAA